MGGTAKIRQGQLKRPSRRLAPNTVHYSPIKSLAAASIFSAAFALAANAQVGVSIDATKIVRTVDQRQFGANTPFWDGTFPSATSLDSFTQMGTTIMRFGGGSATDEYDWSTNKDIVSGDAWAFNIDGFAVQAKAVGAQAIITTNYGSGTPQAAAAYVTYANVTKGYGFKYWEIGNECYGTWEYDKQTNPHDPFTYGTRAVQYIQAMKAADPTIKVGVVADDSEDSYAVGYTSHPATNLVTGVAHNGWTPVVLATMKAAGVLPDFLIYHRYEQNPGQENDSVLLQAALTWPQDAAALRRILTDYLGTAGAGIELLVTENNSVNNNPGKQSVSLVNGLYLADSTANLMQTEINALTWWDFHNGQAFSTTSSPINLNASLYGWRMYGDYGVENQGTNDRYPTFYVAKLLTHFARGGDTVVTATTTNPLLSAYSVKRVDGTLTVLVINKSPTATYTGNFALTGFTPQGNGTVYSYGIPQDTAAQAAATTTAPVTSVGTVVSSWENSLDGWVNQSGPNDAADNYGLEAITGPFLYSTAYSTTTGVTDGSSSLACATTAANPGYSNILQNSTTAMATTLSTAQTIMLKIFPSESGTGAYANATIYFNGSGFTAYYAFPVQSLTLNQENSLSFTLTDAQRASIAASIGTGLFFQVGIIIQANNPITNYFDAFAVTTGSGSSSTPAPASTAAEDVAVTTLSNPGATFSATFGPYSATVISLSPPVTSPVSTGQPTSQTVAAGATAVFSFPTTGSPAPTYQWFLNGTAIPSATDSTLVVSGVTAANAGTYTCTATNSSGAATSNAATLAVSNTTDPGHLINLSARAQVGTGGNIVFGGFAIGPLGTAGSLPILIRGSGPAIAAAPFSVPGTLPDPQLQLFNSANTVLQTNNGWLASPTISATAAAVGAFSWGTTASHDAALDLSEPIGTYTAQIAGQSGDTGDALLEIYDASPSGSFTTGATRLINLSARVDVGTGANVLFAGFVIGGNSAMTVLIRASGPAIAAAPFDVPGTLSDPVLTLRDATSAVLATNGGWGGDGVIAGTAASVGAFAWNVPTSHDSAILVTLPPGNYTAEAAGASGDSGVAIVEVYEVQ
jgi:hypothetical protein